MSGLPLVWQFAERVEAEQLDIGMFYDPEKKMNCIRVDDEIVPIVQTRSAVFGTMTITEAKREEADQDPSNMIEASYGTQTSTRIEREDTDEDPSSMIEASYGTQTITKIKWEETDQD